MSWNYQWMTLALGALTLVGCDEQSSEADEDAPAGGKNDDTAPVNEAGLAVRLSALDTSFLIPAEQAIPLGEGMLGRDQFARIHNQTDFNPSKSNGDIVGDTPDAVYDTLRVVGVRYGSCESAALHGHRDTSTMSSECEEELRLVVQPSSGSGRFGDAAMHLVYGLEPETGREVRNALRQIRTACNGHTEDAGKTDGLPVQIHPCAAEDPAFTQTQIVEGLIAKFAHPARLKGAATMVTVNNGGIEWHWQLLINSPNGIIALPMLPNEPPAARRGIFTFRRDGSFLMTDQVDEAGARLRPTTMLHGAAGESVASADMAAITAVRSAANLDLANPTVQNALVAAYIAENPRLSELPDARAFVGQVFNPPTLQDSIDGADCISCHVQSPLLTVLEDSGLHGRLDDALRARLDAVAYRPLDQIVGGHWDRARASQRQFLVQGNYLVINFGYLFGSPTVNRRVQHEAEDQALHIEQVLRSGDTPAPQPEPEPEPESEDTGASGTGGDAPIETAEPASATCDEAPGTFTATAACSFMTERGDTVLLYETPQGFNLDSSCMTVSIETDDGTDRTQNEVVLTRRTVDGADGWWDANEVLGIVVQDSEARDVRLVHRSVEFDEAIGDSMVCFPFAGE